MTSTGLEAAVEEARGVWAVLRGLLDRHGLDLAQVPLLAEFPPDVAEAYGAWASAMNEVSRSLASLLGITSAKQLTYDVRLRLTLRAWALVMAPEVPRIAHEHVVVTRACPISCLGLSQHSYRPLVNHLGRSKTVGDVHDLAVRDELTEVRGLGPRRIGEIVSALAAVGC